MKSIITNKEIFNENFKNVYQNITLENLLKFSVDNNFVDEQMRESIEENIKNKMLNFLVQKETKEDQMKDIQNLRKKRMEVLTKEVSEYLVYNNNPYEVMELLVNGNIELLINSAIKYCKQMREKLSLKLKYLVENNQDLIAKSFDYKEFIKYVKLYLNEYVDNDTCYYMLDGTNGLDIQNLVNLNLILDKAILESTIVHRFAVKDVLRLASTLESMARNIADLVLTNYILISLYKESAKDLKISEVVAAQIENDIKNNMISATDMEEVIKDGEINFSQMEQDYIISSLTYKFGKNQLKGEYIRN